MKYKSLLIVSLFSNLSASQLAQAPIEVGEPIGQKIDPVSIIDQQPAQQPVGKAHRMRSKESPCLKRCEAVAAACIFCLQCCKVVADCIACIGDCVK